MGTNQKYSQRIHTKRQLIRACDHFKQAGGLLTDVGQRYAGALPRVSLACVEMIEMVKMLETMIEDIKDNI